MELIGWADLTGRFRQALTSASYLVLLSLGLHAGTTTGWLVSLGFITSLGFVAWAATYRRARAIADIATSRIGSAAQGYVELVGRAGVAPDELILSPFTATACIWYRYRVYEKTSSQSAWREIDSGVSHASFEISDGNGACRIDPDDAEVIGAETRVTYEDGHKRVEEMLFGGGLVYVLGELSTSGGSHTVLSASEDVGSLLAAWKQNPVRLRQRFDLDRNGEIDLREWELARRLASRTVEREHREIRSAAEDHDVRAPVNGSLFLISALPPHTLRRRYLRWSVFHLGVALSGLGLFVWLKH